MSKINFGRMAGWLENWMVELERGFLIHPIIPKNTPDVQIKLEYEIILDNIEGR